MARGQIPMQAPIDERLRQAVVDLIYATDGNPGTDLVLIHGHTPVAVTATLFSSATAIEYVLPYTIADRRVPLRLGTASVHELDLDGPVIREMMGAYRSGTPGHPEPGPEALLSVAGRIAQEQREAKDALRLDRNLDMLALADRYGWTNIAQIGRLVDMQRAPARDLLDTYRKKGLPLPTYPDGGACLAHLEAIQAAVVTHQRKEDTAIRVRDPLIRDFTLKRYGEQYHPSAVARLASVTPARVTQIMQGGEYAAYRRTVSAQQAKRAGRYRRSSPSGRRVVMLPVAEPAYVADVLLDTDQRCRDILGGNQWTTTPLRDASGDDPALSLICVPDATRPLNRLASAVAVQYDQHVRVRGLAVLAAWDDRGRPVDVPEDVVRLMVADPAA